MKENLFLGMQGFLFQSSKYGGESAGGGSTSTVNGISTKTTPPPPPNFEDLLSQVHTDIVKNYNAPVVKGNYTAADESV